MAIKCQKTTRICSFSRIGLLHIWPASLTSHIVSVNWGMALDILVDRFRNYCDHQPLYGNSIHVLQQCKWSLFRFI